MARYNTWDEFMMAQSELLQPINEFVVKERQQSTVCLVHPTANAAVIELRSTSLHFAGCRCARTRKDGYSSLIYPPAADVFNFTKTPLRDVKVVILGQDPYHGRGQADGLAFSVREGVALPPSLRNVFKELDSDYFELIRQAVRKASGHVNRNGDYLHFDGVTGLPALPIHGNLTPWTRRGVLLLNTGLTVREGEAGSHCDIWQPFTDEVIRAVCDSATMAPHFILWGAKAKKALERVLGRLVQYEVVGLGCRNPGIAARLITATYSAHPSPLSADKGFVGSRPFSRANLALTLNNPGCAPVDWRLS